MGDTDTAVATPIPTSHIGAIKPNTDCEAHISVMASNTAPAIRHPIPIRKTLGLPHLGITRPIKRAVNTMAIATVANSRLKPS
ncbi:hypothetical protein VAWG006_41140 [Aeromonas enteropelogenes]|nr:hypothetical protein VAWG006_41140 [Aeromonas enteropelogenes]GFM43657.1 hypothetical protein MAKP1_49990 [Klebsiella pneumoniae subsp. pneumoniae]